MLPYLKINSPYYCADFCINDFVILKLKGFVHFSTKVFYMIRDRELQKGSSDNHMKVRYTKEAPLF